MFSFRELYRFPKTRIGEVVLCVIILTLPVALCWKVFTRVDAVARESNQMGAHGRAIQEALGFTGTALGDYAGDTYIDKGTGILKIEPDGPFDRAGLKPDDRIALKHSIHKVLLIHRRGKTVVLPVERAGRRFKVTVKVPRFTVPYPELLSAAPVAPRP